MSKVAVKLQQKCGRTVIHFTQSTIPSTSMACSNWCFKKSTSCNL